MPYTFGRLQKREKTEKQEKNQKVGDYFVGEKLLTPEPEVTSKQGRGEQGGKKTITSPVNLWQELGTKEKGGSETLDKIKVTEPFPLRKKTGKELLPVIE